MKQLINIQKNADGKQAVSAKELYKKLGLAPTQWSRWAVKNIEKNIFAKEGRDWVRFDFVSNGSETKDYVLTLDFAKNLCMLSRTERGQQVRNYFLEVEKIAMEATQPAISEKRLQALENKLKRLEAATVTSEIHEFSIFGYCGLHKIRLYGTEAQSIGKLAAKRCRELNAPVGKIRDIRFGMVNTYPEYVLKHVFEEFLSKPRF